MQENKPLDESRKTAQTSGTKMAPRVSVCGYNIPHPSEARVNIRVQTTGDPAKGVLKDSCQDLMMICQHVRSTFDQVVADFKNNNGFESD
ncbi:putative DNA-directed RNA polymerase, RBP11-like dimerization domain-containing protein [Helianthus anomalus]